MDFRVAWLPLDQIDTQNLAYRVTTTEDKTSIVESVDRIGLIIPVAVKRARDQHIIVSGYRRVDACRILNWRKIPCRILPDHLDAMQYAEMAVSENCTQRPLNLVEQGRCLRLLAEPAGDLSRATQIVKTLGLSLNKELSAKLRIVLASPDLIQSGLVLGKLSLSIVLALSDFPKEDAESLASLFMGLPMGLNKQREVLLNLKEIAAREDKSVTDLLEENALKVLLEDDRMDGNQKSHAIRVYCKKRRYPRMVQVEEKFYDSVRKLGLGSTIQISPPPGFEGRTCTMTIRFASLADLKNAQRKLAETIVHPAVSNLFD